MINFYLPVPVGSNINHLRSVDTMKTHFQSGLLIAVCAFLVVQTGGCAFSSIEQETSGRQNPGPIDQTGTPELSSTAHSNKTAAILPAALKTEKNRTMDASGRTMPGENELPAMNRAGIAAPDPDLWQHLRKNFRLEYSENHQPAVEKFERWYARHPKYFKRLAARAYWLLPFIADEVEKRAMPAEIALLPAIESAFRHEATSRSNAVGLWQMISATGRRFGLRQDWWMDGRRDMVQSTRAALDYLEYLSREFDGDWLLALAGYNAGEGNIRKQIRRNRAAHKPTDYWSLALPRETQQYVPKLLAIRNIINDPQKYGIALSSIPNRPTLAVIDARIQTDLSVAASLIPVPAKQLHSLNSGYKRGVTPPTGPHTIVVPVEYADTLLADLNNLTLQQRMRWARHQVRKGEYLGQIARKHGVTVESIAAVNQLSSTLIQPGQELKIPLGTGHYRYAKAAGSDIRIQDGDKIYTIKSGDTLWKLSQDFGMSLTKLLRWNGLTKKTLLHPGQQIIIGRSS